MSPLLRPRFSDCSGRGCFCGCQAPGAQPAGAVSGRCGAASRACGAVPAVAGAAGRAVCRKHRRPRRRMEAEPERAEAPRRGGVAGVSGPRAGAGPASPSGGLRGLGPRPGCRGAPCGGRAEARRGERPPVGPSSAAGAGRAGGGCGALTCGRWCLCTEGTAPRCGAVPGVLLPAMKRLLSLTVCPLLLRVSSCATGTKDGPSSPPRPLCR